MLTTRVRCLFSENFPSCLISVTLQQTFRCFIMAFTYFKSCSYLSLVLLEFSSGIPRNLIPSHCSLFTSVLYDGSFGNFGSAGGVVFKKVFVFILLSSVLSDKLLAFISALSSSISVCIPFSSSLLLANCSIMRSFFRSTHFWHTSSTLFIILLTPKIASVDIPVHLVVKCILLPHATQ